MEATTTPTAGGGLATLHAVLAAAKSKRAILQQALTNVSRAFGKTDSFEGVSKTYAPTNEDGTKIAPEIKRVAARVDTLLEDLFKTTAEAWDVVGTQELGNQQAKADLVLNEVVLASNVPVTMLLFMEKQLDWMIDQVLSNIPVLDQARVWNWEAGEGLHKTNPVQSARTEKVKESLVLAAATEKHPAQTQVVDVDKPVGYYSTQFSSSAFTVTNRQQIVERARELKAAVQEARSRANTQQIAPFKSSKIILNHILGG
jgi:hypothetical protein